MSLAQSTQALMRSCCLQTVRKTYPILSLFCLHAGYLFSQQGIKSCAVNTSAAIGTTFSITFVVFDYSIPSLNASVTRTGIIVNPCASGQYLCSDGTCSTVACNLRQTPFFTVPLVTEFLLTSWSHLNSRDKKMRTHFVTCIFYFQCGIRLFAVLGPVAIPHWTGQTGSDFCQAASNLTWSLMQWLLHASNKHHAIVSTNLQQAFCRSFCTPQLADPAGANHKDCFNSTTKAILASGYTAMACCYSTIRL